MQNNINMASETNTLFPLNDNKIKTVLDLETLKICKYDTQLFKNSTNVTYLEGETPNVYKYVASLMNNDIGKIKELQMCLGHCLINTQNNCLYVFYGAGSNGKSSLLKILRKILTESMGKRIAHAVYHEGWNNNCPRAAFLYDVDLNDGCFSVDDCYDLLQQTKVIAETNTYPYKILNETTKHKIKVIEFPVKFVADKNRDSAMVEDMYTVHLSEMFTWIARGANMWLDENK